MKKHLESISKIFLQSVIDLRYFWAKKIVSLNAVLIGGIYFLAFLIGRFILYKEPFCFGLVHQICLTNISLIVIYMLKYCYTMGDKLLKESSGLLGSFEKKRKNKLTQNTMYKHVETMKKYQKSIWCFIVCIMGLKPSPLGETFR